MSRRGRHTEALTRPPRHAGIERRRPPNRREWIAGILSLLILAISGAAATLAFYLVFHQ